jgi:hypothetical protein
MKIMNVKGTVDSLPSKEIIRRKVVNTLTDTFEKYGYLPLDTSILCYYDLLASKYSGGSEILKDYLETVYNIKLKKYLDAGCELYLDSQNTYAGGSGPACLPIVLFNKILLNKKYKKILLVATGALHSPTTVNQHGTIPSIAHAISLEVE